MRKISRFLFLQEQNRTQFSKRITIITDIKSVNAFFKTPATQSQKAVKGPGDESIIRINITTIFYHQINPCGPINTFPFALRWRCIVFIRKWTINIYLLHSASSTKHNTYYENLDIASE